MRGIKFGLYPSASAAAKIFRLASADTRFPPEKARDTADWDTPAKRATSVDEGYLRPESITTCAV
jgi:hypothetical protein